MQYAFSDFPSSQRSEQEYERPSQEYSDYASSRRIDAGEKIAPPLQAQKNKKRLLRQWIVVLVSLPILALICAAIFLTYSPGVWPDLLNLHLFFAFFGVSCLDTIICLFLSRSIARPKRRGVVKRLVFAVVTGLLTPVACWLMIEGANGLDGVLLVLVMAIGLNLVSYLTLCEKREAAQQSQQTHPGSL